jgi:arylsulfatase A-like enzyme
MKTNKTLAIWTVLALFGLNSFAQQTQKPNVIYILADDLGYGDLSCYGQKKFRTPNLDKLAAKGIKLTQHYSGSTVCAPSRSALMTGQHTGHTPIRGNRELPDEGQTPIPAASETIAEVFKKAGYVTGAFGKWGLGFVGTEGDPNKQGFDEFFGYNCQRKAHRYYTPYLWHNAEKVFLPGNDYMHTVTFSQDVIQDATLEFISKNKENPFFAYIPFVLPHAEIIAPNDSIYTMFKGNFIEDKPYAPPANSGNDYGPGLIEAKYASQKEPHAVYAAMVTRIDVYVGQIMAKLEDLGIAENTLVIFTSDNGPSVEGGADPAFFNGTAGLRGVKRDLYEGGIRSPFLAVWPNKIKPGIVSDHISAFWDMKPTFADLLGVQSIQTDGISMLPTLLGKKGQKQHAYLYWEFTEGKPKTALRKGDWKAIYFLEEKNPKEAFQLYNLKNDPYEKENIAAQNPKMVDQMKQIIQDSHVESALFPLVKK